ncbi:MAG: glycosyltransferase, partial [Candidatus Omnitrophica bacterium]|nr:glycosyltransferase [Candidatus Omnitrophota bacterium]
MKQSSKHSTTRLLSKKRQDITKKTRKPSKAGGLRTKGYYKKSYPSKPLLTIITAVLNNKDYLEETVNSVLNQSYDNVEYIIIDGRSTDRTLDIIKKYE